ncbi:MAG TPA: type IV pilus twitching motility protein PilT [Gemmatimonadales bacterium]
MAARIDPFIDVLLRERGDQLYLLPDEPVTMVKSGQSRRISKQPLTDEHIYALLVEMAPPESADRIDQSNETSFDYAADRGLVRVRIVPELGRLTAVVAPLERSEPAANREPATPRAAAGGPVSAPPAPRNESRGHGNPGGSAIETAADEGELAAPSPPAHRAPPVPPAPRAAAGSSVPTDAAAPQNQAAQRALEELLRALVASKSSDLHLRVGEPPVFRTHGVMNRQSTAPLSAGHLEVMLLAIMPERNRVEWRETGDSDFAYEIAGVARFRVNAGRDRKGPIAVFRVIPAQVVTADQLGLSKEVQHLCYLTKGLVLVTGPTGSGKSTTLCALVDLINRTRSDHIITVEDPIEFVHENKKCIVTQRQVGVHTETFRSALRAALREDPDILLVGEMRDLETVAIAIETAETGHLVFGTLHTTTAPSTLDRVIDQFPGDRQSQIRVMLSESLKGVIAQTLCKRIAGGRVAAREILLATPAVSNLIREGKTFQLPSIIQTSKQLGMVTMNDSLLELVEKKEIGPDEAYMKSVDKVSLVGALKARGHKLTLTA